ncbi:MAG TPA: nucleotidyltransferase domain-containing protein, partial [Acidimicrobiales bacterium]|nr:nucleotidyltransferase domain-containing protein [Acidimicrobiales bacterium]
MTATQAGGYVRDVHKLSTAWARLREDQDLRGREWSRSAQALTDAWLRSLFEQAIDATAARKAAVGKSVRPPARAGGWRLWGRAEAERVAEGGTAAGPAAAGTTPAGSVTPGVMAAAGVALLAVGSLGRGDLAPGSDLDLLLVHSGRPDVVEVADRLWYPIWDDPMPLDHSVRTLSQMEQAAESDLRVAQGLLEARPLAGDMQLASKVLALARRLWEKRASRWLPEILEARKAAHLAQGDVAFLLEPDLQEGRGGLRDLQLLGLMATVTPVVRPDISDERLAPAGDCLHAVRVELQRLNGRRGDRLTLEEQDRVADALGMPSREELAREVAAAGRTVAWLSEDAWRRVGSW